MTAEPVQDAEHIALCNDHAAVARLELITGELSLVARDELGEVRATTVVDRAGDRLEPRDAIEALIAARAHAQSVVADTTDHLRIHLIALRDAGTLLNVAELSRATGIARSTFYNWVGQSAAA